MLSNPQDSILGLLNRSGIMQSVSRMHHSILNLLSSMIPGKPEKLPAHEVDKQMLSSVGPAAAASAIDYALNEMKNRQLLINKGFTGNQFHDHEQFVKNTESYTDAYQNYSSTLRQFLLPRYAFLNFDTMIDPRHQIDAECGYPRHITPIMYRFMYERDDVAHRVVNLYPDETWVVDPIVYETDNEKRDTEFEKDWQGILDTHNFLQYLYRIDKMSGIGHYGTLLLGVDDGKDLSEPIDEPGLLKGEKNYVAKKRREFTYARPFDEYLSFVQSYDMDPNSPRFGRPEFYNLVFVNMNLNSAGSAIGTRVTRRVHWTRVIHVADNLHDSLAMGTPRMQPVFNRLLDLRKIKGGSPEMFWKGGFPGLAFEINPDLATDDIQFDKDEFNREIDAYSNGLRRNLRLIGIKAQTLNPNIADPKAHVDIQMQAIAAHYGAPLRIFMGSEEGRLASNEDSLRWNKRLGRRIRVHVDPNILKATAERLVAIGAIAPPKKGNTIKTGWADLNTPTDEDKANLSLKWTQAISQYVASGAIHLIPPQEYFITIMNMKPRDALRIVGLAEKLGGWKKLMRVDPSQGAGVNGNRQNLIGTKSKTKGRANAGPKKRDTNQKKIEGKTS